MDQESRKVQAEESEKPEKALSELELENERLKKENELLKEYQASLPLKERLYDRIPLTVKDYYSASGSSGRSSSSRAYRPIKRLGKTYDS